MKKYELTDETIDYKGSTLYRIRALKDFGFVKKGDIGGYIEKEENLSHYGECWVYDIAKVYEDAKVEDNACVFEYAQMSGHSHIIRDAQISGFMKVSEYFVSFDGLISHRFTPETEEDFADLLNNNPRDNNYFHNKSRLPRIYEDRYCNIKMDHGNTMCEKLISKKDRLREDLMKTEIGKHFLEYLEESE